MGWVSRVVTRLQVTRLGCSLSSGALVPRGLGSTVTVRCNLFLAFSVFDVKEGARKRPCSFVPGETACGAAAESTVTRREPEGLADGCPIWTPPPRDRTEWFGDDTGLYSPRWAAQERPGSRWETGHGDLSGVLRTFGLPLWRCCLWVTAFYLKPSETRGPGLGGPRARSRVRQAARTRCGRGEEGW